MMNRLLPTSLVSGLAGALVLFLGGDVDRSIEEASLAANKPRALLQMATLPLLSLGFMVAGQSALLGGGVHPGQFFEPLRGSPQKRRALITLRQLLGEPGARATA